MEISVLDSRITRFQNPDFLILHLKTLWTWAALIVATFNGLFMRSKRVILRFRKNKSVTLQQFSCTYSSDDEDSDDVSCSSSSDDEDNDDVPCSTSSPPDDEDEEMEKDFDDFEELIQGQNGKCDHHFTWSCDGSVVKLWDEIPTVHVEVVLSGGTGRLNVWDARADGKACVSAKWQAEGIGRMVRIHVGKNEEVYAKDDGGKLTVVDLRNVRALLAERCWSGDTVTVGDGNWMVLT